MPENTNKVIQLKDAEGNDVSPVVNVGSIYDKNGQKVDNLLSYTVAGTDVPVPSINDMLPIGSIIYATKKPSDNWIECNGQCFSQSKYPKLAELYPRDDPSVLATAKTVTKPGSGWFPYFVAPKSSNETQILLTQSSSNNRTISMHAKNDDFINSSVSLYPASVWNDNYQIITGRVLSGSGCADLNLTISNPSSESVAYMDGKFYLSTGGLQLAWDGSAGTRNAILHSTNPWKNLVLDIEYAYQTPSSSINSIISTKSGAYACFMSNTSTSNYCFSIVDLDRMTSEQPGGYCYRNLDMVSAGTRLFLYANIDYTTQVSSGSRYLYGVDLYKSDPFVKITDSVLSKVSTGVEYDGFVYISVIEAGASSTLTIYKISSDFSSCEKYTGPSGTGINIHEIYYLDDNIIIAKVIGASGTAIGKFDVDHNTKTFSNYTAISAFYADGNAMALNATRLRTDFVNGIVFPLFGSGSEMPSSTAALYYYGPFHGHTLPYIHPANGTSAYILAK